MFSWRSHKENTELTERFLILENERLIQDLSGIHRLGKLTVNEGFLAVMYSGGFKNGKITVKWQLLFEV